jgi:hypothetical protein
MDGGGTYLLDGLLDPIANRALGKVVSYEVGQVALAVKVF